MDIFTEVYKKSTDLLVAQTFDKRWSNVEPKIKALFGADGPDSAQKDVLELVRTTLADAAKGKAKPAEAIADEILDLARQADTGFQDRAALIKLLKHFYFVEKKGNQSIWVVDHPSDYDKWAYDQLNGMTAANAKTALQKDTETFGTSHRDTMSDSLQLARKWAGDIVAKLGTADDTTKAKVKKWFHGDTASDVDVNGSVATLLDGFKKICDATNASKVIFSDRPHKRAGNTSTYASVNSGDKMPVIYIFKLFLDEGKRVNGEVGKMWLLALTIVHELSHKIQGTKDKSYDYQGLKPGGRSLTVADAIINADSWGYFAADMVGALTEDKLKEVLK